MISQPTQSSNTARSPSDPSLLLLIPAFNEEQRIRPVLESYARSFREHYHGRWEILVVLNGCEDRTAAVVESVAKQFPEIRYLDIPERIGKGGALIEGLKHRAGFELVGYVDADGATPPHAFLDLVRQLNGYDAVIGSRWLPESKVLIPQTPMRRFFSRAFHLLVELLFHLGIKDTQCGAKVIRTQAIDRIFHALTITDMAFDINLLYSLRKSGYRIREVPTEWEDKLGSKVKFGRASFAWLCSLFRLRLIYSPFRPLLRWLRPLETWLYTKLLASPSPLPVQEKSSSSTTSSDDVSQG